MNRKNIMKTVEGFGVVEAAWYLEQAKKLSLIPHFEGMTVQQIAEYFGVSEKRIYNIVRMNTYHKTLLKGDVVSVNSKELRSFAKLIVDHGVHDGLTATFVNGVEAKISHSSQIIVNPRGILKIAVFLKESETARNVTSLVNLINESQIAPPAPAANTKKIPWQQQAFKFNMNPPIVIRAAELAE